MSLKICKSSLCYTAWRTAPSKNTYPEEQWTISAKNPGHTSKLGGKKDTEGWKLIPESRKMLVLETRK